MSTVPAAAKNSREKTESEMRMDGFTSTLNEYSTKVMELNQDLEEAQARKSKLQNVLETMCQCTAKLRTRVEAHRVQDQVRKECERKELQCIEQLNKDLQAAKEQLKLTSRLGDELLARRREEVSRFEAVMREVRSEFQSLMLLEKGEDNGSEAVAKELVKLVEEVAMLEDQRSLLIADDISHLSVDLASLLSVVSEGSEFLETLKKRNRKLKDEEASLKQKLECMQQKEKTGSAQQQDTHTTQQ
ncbi:uncharacterized protein LOC135114852 [Scylla paramamosain]|uniref:uncharacterized protein LOC135114852 n=1 Tax=Scylla paramamosain TaxID=85552 RepID=UPI00308366DB